MGRTGRADMAEQKQVGKGRHTPGERKHRTGSRTVRDSHQQWQNVSVKEEKRGWEGHLESKYGES